jgi:hypothetical protein
MTLSDSIQRRPTFFLYMSLLQTFMKQDTSYILYFSRKDHRFQEIYWEIVNDSISVNIFY